jgi:transposase
MVKTTEELRWRMVGMSDAGMSGAAIGRALGVPARTVQAFLARHRQNPATVKDRPRSGRPRISTARQDRALARDARHHRFVPSPILRHRWRVLQGVRASRRTVLRRLNAGRLRARIPLIKPALTERHKQVIIVVYCQCEYACACVCVRACVRVCINSPFPVADLQ